MEEDNRKIINDLKSVLNLIKRYVDKNIGKTALGQITGMQAMIISYLKDCQIMQKDVFQKDIEDEFNIRGSTVSKMLGLMIEKKLITRINVDYDARLKKIVLTDYGEQIKMEITEQMEQLNENLQQGLSKDELEVFFRVMDKIKDNLE